MPVLDCSILMQSWMREAGGTNGATHGQLGIPACSKGTDAGPWEPAIQKIVAFQQLADDWDGLGAKAPTLELLESAIGLAHVFCDKGIDPPQCVVPSLDGAVVFEWQDADGSLTEVEIDRPFHAEVMMIKPGQPAEHWTLPTD